jgi:hypothetical protein
VQDRDIKKVREIVHDRIEDYKKAKRNHTGQEVPKALAQTTAGMPSLVLPYILERVWHRVDWQAQKYLLTRS